MRNQPTGHTGRHFLQIPGPTNVPDRILHAIAFPTIDHRGPEFSGLGKEVVAGLRRVFQTSGTVVIYPSSGTGAWEAALVNTLSPGDGVLMVETGHFAALWRQMAGRLGHDIELELGHYRSRRAERLDDNIAGRRRQQLVRDRRQRLGQQRLVLLQRRQLGLRHLQAREIIRSRRTPGPIYPHPQQLKNGSLPAQGPEGCQRPRSTEVPVVDLTGGPPG